MKIKLLCVFVLYSFSMVYAQNTIIPDPNFEQRLIDMGYDIGPIDGFVPTSNIDTVTDLWVPNSSILDLTGIEDFQALETLDITGNGIAALDMSGNPALRELYTETNPIASINLTNNSALEIARLGHMQLNALDVSNNTLLTDLRCNSNQLTSLDVSNNFALTSLRCSSNQLCSLDVSLQPLLDTLFCSDNMITYLNVKNGANNLLTSFSATLNQVGLCIQVDDEVAANGNTGVYASWLVDAGISYSESCNLGMEINLIGNGLSISSGDTTPNVTDDTDYGTVSFGSFADRTFTIENQGDVDLNLTGTPLVEITNSVDFTVLIPPNSLILANGGTTQFTLRYTPSMAGTINTGILSINNDDCDEDPYVFHVRGESSSTLGFNKVLLDDQLRLFPNPVTEYITLKYSGSEIIEVITLFDIIGKQIKQFSYNTFNDQYQLDLRHLKGIYLLLIKTNNSQTLRKLVIN